MKLIRLNQVFYQSASHRISCFSLWKKLDLKHVWSNHLTSFFRSYYQRNDVECTCQILMARTELMTLISKSLFRDILLTLRNYWWQESERHHFENWFTLLTIDKCDKFLWTKGQLKKHTAHRWLKRDSLKLLGFGNVRELSNLIVTNWRSNLIVTRWRMRATHGEQTNEPPQTEMI